MTKAKRKARKRPAMTKSQSMARVRHKDTKPELLLRRALWAEGVRYRLHDRGLPGTPDLVFPGHRVAVFVHGCFWHGHEGCPKATMPKSNQEFWQEKLGRNRTRDERVQAELRALGWLPVVVWECESIGGAVQRVRGALAVLRT